MPFASSAIRLEDRKTCPVCHCLGRSIYSGLRDRLFDTGGVWSMSRCSDEACGLLWLDPRPIEEDIHRAYKSYYTHAPRHFARPLVATLVSTTFRGLSYATLLAGRLLQERAAVANMHLGGLAPGRLLDVGCGDGAFLQRMKAFGWTVEGCDFDESAARTAESRYGITVKVGRLSDIAYPGDSFDAVTLNHVIEHLHDPVAVLREIERILKPSGTVIAVTPNATSWGHGIYGSDWRGLEPPRHIHVFSLGALRTVVERAGLLPNRVYSTAANAHFVLASSMAMSHATPDASGPRRPSAGMFLKALGMTLREARCNARTGDAGEEIVIVARKRD